MQKILQPCQWHDRMSHTYTKVAVHALFATKGRQPWLTSALRTDLFAYMAGIIKRLGARPIIVGGYSEHVHLIFVLPAPLPLADLMEKLKANSSRWLHQQTRTSRGFAWQKGLHRVQCERVEFGASQKIRRRARTTPSQDGVS